MEIITGILVGFPLGVVVTWMICRWSVRHAGAVFRTRGHYRTAHLLEHVLDQSAEESADEFDNDKFRADFCKPIGGANSYGMVFRELQK